MDGRGGSVDESTRVCPPTWLRSASNFAKTRFRRSPSTQFSTRKTFVHEIFRSRKSFLAFLSWFWSLQRKTDLKINFLAIFCSRCKYSELRTTKNRKKYVRLRSIATACKLYPPRTVPPQSGRVISIFSISAHCVSLARTHNSSRRHFRPFLAVWGLDAQMIMS